MDHCRFSNLNLSFLEFRVCFHTFERVLTPMHKGWIWDIFIFVVPGGVNVNSLNILSFVGLLFVRSSVNLSSAFVIIIYSEFVNRFLYLPVQLNYEYLINTC